MDLFETRPAAIQVEVSSPASMPADEPAAEAPQGHTTEPSAPSATVTPAEPDSQEAETVEETDGEPRIATEPKEERRLRPLSAPPPVNPALLRKAVNQIRPLFEGKDPGARDCLKANRNAFRSAFTPEGYVEFEQSVKGSDFDAALEHLRKAARRHGISV
jgi:hypothetical protein